MPVILAIGANPCWEKVLHFASFLPGEVNRATEVGGYAAGKATNFCRALKCLGGPVTGRQLTFLGGDAGRAFAEDLAREGLDLRFVPVDAETRTCTNCICGGVMTELVEPGAAPSDAAVRDFLALLEQNAAEASGIALTGSIPKGTLPSFAPDIARIAGRRALPLLLDNWQAAPEILATGVCAILKINAEELGRLTGAAAVPDGLALLHHRWPQLTAGITAGPDAAWLLLPDDATPVRLAPPRLDRVVNPLGAGDTCSAVFFARLLQGATPSQAFQAGLDAASRSCLTDKAGVF
jgi:fructose-1-phosphate kinase PfkB-like protein